MSRSSAGLPFSHVRALEPDERAWLTERAKGVRRCRVVLGWGTALIPLVLCLPFALSFLNDAAALLMIPATWGCIIFPLKWIDARKRSAVAIASGDAEEVDVFEGIVSGSVFAEGSLTKLLDAGLLLDEKTPQRIERIRASGEAIVLNGSRLDPPVWVDETDVAPPVLPSPEFPSLVPGFAMADPSLERRPLSTAELEELRRLRPVRESLRQNGCLLGFCLYLLAGTFQKIEGQPGATFFFGALRLVTLGYLVWRFYLAGRGRTRQRRDLAEASVLRIQDEGAWLEVLPHLGLVWTVDGQPSSWRHAAQSGPRPPR